jgi:hypothetical protein
LSFNIFEKITIFKQKSQSLFGGSRAGANANGNNNVNNNEKAQTNNNAGASSTVSANKAR